MNPTRLGKVFAPYCIRKLISGRYVLLNRLYKPLGFHEKITLDYEQFAHNIRIKPSDARRISADGMGFQDCRIHEGEKVLWLYRDADNPFIKRENGGTQEERTATGQAITRIHRAMQLTITTEGEE